MKETIKNNSMKSVIIGEFTAHDVTYQYTMDYQELRENNGPKHIIMDAKFSKAFYLDSLMLSEIKNVLGQYISFHVVRDQMDYSHRIGLAGKMEQLVTDTLTKLPADVASNGKINNIRLTLGEVHEFVEEINNEAR